MRAVSVVFVVFVALFGAVLGSQRASVADQPYKAFAPMLAADAAGPPATAGKIAISGTRFNSWDPHFSDFSQDIEHFHMVWRGLYEFDANMHPAPSMAAGMPSISGDGQTYTITLKPGLRWSDGHSLDAEDFVAGIQRSCNPDIASHYEFILTNIVGCDAYYAAAGASPAGKEALREGVGVKALNATTVEIKLQEPQPTLTSILTMWPTFPVPRHKVPTVAAAWPGPLDNVYNGPFRPTLSDAAKMELAPNPNWAGAQKPGVEEIVIHYIDSATAVNAYRAGIIDATFVDASQIAGLKGEFPAELYLYASTRTIGLQFNLNDPLLAKPGVRLALSRSIDRDVLNEVVFQGVNSPTTSWMPPARSGAPAGTYDGILGLNVAAAQDDLADAGYPDGAGWPGLTFLLTDSALNRALGEFLRAEWSAKLNISVQLEIVSSQERSDRFNSMDYQMVVGGWQEDYPDPENWFLGQWETGGSINKTGTSIPALDALLAAAKSNANDAERRQQYRDAEAILLEEANGIAPLWHTQARFLVKPYISGMVENKRPGDTFAPGGWSPEYWRPTKP
ncbi:MAG TPA: peptide ABC transporter substrate-binding protein [Tepidiformaceae bacterium]|nr:peptide ABC transporter substrate-binding protein [Tepidiformaceae bacterium]